MIYYTPSNWEKDSSLENLFLFYQKSNELLFRHTVDSYKLPIHNVFSIIKEISGVSALLRISNTVDRYFESYISPMIDEFLFLANNDKIFKKMMGEYFGEVINKFDKSRKDYNGIDNLIKILKRKLIITDYISLLKDELSNIIQNDINNKDDLIIFTKNLYIALILYGYSKEFLFKRTEKFFRKEYIHSSSQINNFFDIFSCEKTQFNFLLAIDTSVLDYMPNTLSDDFGEKKLIKVSQEEFLEEKSVQMLFNFCKSKKKKKINNISVFSFISDGIDPYMCVSRLQKKLIRYQEMIRYFNHQYKFKMIRAVFLKKENGIYERIYIDTSEKNQKEQSKELVKTRCHNFLSYNNLGGSAHFSIFHAFDLHAEAINSRSSSVQLRVFWTAMEAIFSLKNAKIDKEDMIDSIISIIQKTYIIKIFTLLYNQFCRYVNSANIATFQSIDITSLDKFIEFFVKFDSANEEWREISEELSKSPLLMYRINQTKKMLQNGKSIETLLENHKKKILWQLKRIGTVRNISTHLGVEMDHIEDNVKYLHNYFDYIIDFMLCCVENNKYIDSIPEMVMELSIENKMHINYLRSKKDEPLTIDNYKKLLFGADEKIINYNFIS